MTSRIILPAAFLACVLSAATIPADISTVRPGPIRVAATADSLTVEWPDERRVAWRAEFSLDPAKPLLTSIRAGDAAIVSGARPFYWVETGKRRGGWDQFFDFPPSHPDGTRRFQHDFKPARAVAKSFGERVEVYFEGLRLGIFSGGIAYRFFPGSRLIQQEAVASTNEPDTAYFYDAGFQWNEEADRRSGGNMESALVWYDAEGRQQRGVLPYGSERVPFKVRYRALAARTSGGGIAVFPAPHQYFFARDYTTNMSNLWARSWRGQVGLGIRQLPDDHSPFYPWMNAPPGTMQRMSLFLLVSNEGADQALEDVLRFTNRDRYPAINGYKTLASHWHLAYTGQAVDKGLQWTPPFKPILKAMGIDAAMIMDFHGDGHPRDTTKLRLEELKAFYAACRAQTDPQFLLIPGEEANVHLGGHWSVTFPKKTLWIMSRQGSQAFVTEEPGFGRVYRTADASDVFNMVQREGGLVYQTHPRTKGSMGFPDKVKGEIFYQHESFFGAGWKAMPSDLSTLRQGLRSLNLLDDMNNWGQRKKLLGEVDVFQLDNTHELYAHMNVSYVRMASLPGFDNYGQILDALFRGDFFVSQGEVLLPEFKFKKTGDSLSVTSKVQWTMPLAEAWIVWSDGKETHRNRLGLEETRSFGNVEFTWNLESKGAQWARLEVWDIAGSGAFTNPVWFEWGRPQ